MRKTIACGFGANWKNLNYGDDRSISYSRKTKIPIVGTIHPTLHYTMDLTLHPMIHPTIRNTIYSTVHSTIHPTIGHALFSSSTSPLKPILTTPPITSKNLNITPPLPCPTLFRVVNLYLYHPLHNLHTLRTYLLEQCEGWDIRGRVYLSLEGVNGSMLVPEINMEVFSKWMKSLPIFRGIKIFAMDVIDTTTLSSEDIPFAKLHVRIRDLVADGQRGEQYNMKDTGNGLTPDEWDTLILQQQLKNYTMKSRTNSQSNTHSHSHSHSMKNLTHSHNTYDNDTDESSDYSINNDFDVIEGDDSIKSNTDKFKNGSDVVVVDCRNYYESEVGRFVGGERLPIQKHEESFDALDTVLQGRKHSKVLLYCTGGIRCEKLSAYLIQRKGYKDVNRLEGGINYYLHRHKLKQRERKKETMSKYILASDATTTTTNTTTTTTTTDTTTTTKLNNNNNSTNYIVQHTPSLFFGRNVLFDDTFLRNRVTQKPALSQTQTHSLPPPSSSTTQLLQQQQQIQQKPQPPRPPFLSSLPSNTHPLSQCYHCNTPADILANCTNPLCNSLYITCTGCKSHLSGCCCEECSDFLSLSPPTRHHYQQQATHHRQHGIPYPRHPHLEHTETHQHIETETDTNPFTHTVNRETDTTTTTTTTTTTLTTHNSTSRRRSLLSIPTLPPNLSNTHSLYHTTPSYLCPCITKGMRNNTSIGRNYSSITNNNNNNNNDICINLSTALPESLSGIYTRTCHTYPKIGRNLMVDPLVGLFLRQLVIAANARKILEIGCFTGFSMACMMSGMVGGGEIVTLDRDRRAVELALDNLMWAYNCSSREEKDENEDIRRDGRLLFDIEDKQVKVSVMVGEAMDNLVTLKEKQSNNERIDISEQFDICFIDADKRGYLQYYEYILDKKLLRVGGIIVADNCLWKGKVEEMYRGRADKDVMEKKIEHEEENNNIDRRGESLLHFVETIKNDGRVDSVILPMCDGVLLATVKKYHE